MLALIRQFFTKKDPNGIRRKVENQDQAPNPNSTQGAMVFHQRLNVATCQSPGIERFHNEDSLFTMNTTLSSVEGATNFGIFLVADGMGGHQNGEVASFLSAQASSKTLMDSIFDSVVYQKKTASEIDCQKLIVSAFDNAQKLVKQRAPGGGTTLTLVLAIDEHFFTGHVGDCRSYLIDLDGKLSLRTKDHSLVKRLIDLGEISEVEASTHPQRNMLYRALGQTDPFEPDMDQFDLATGEKLLICSDGLWGVLEAQQIEQIIKRAVNLEQAACRLVRAANDAGGPDNISVVLIERIH